MRRAEWRENVSVGKFSFARFSAEILRLAQNVLTGSCLLLPFFAGWYDAVNAGWFFGLVAAVGAFFGMATLVFLTHRFFEKRPLGDIERVLPLPLPVDTFPVSVTVYQGKRVTGRDEAAASFVDGWLYVEGIAASFGYRVCDGASINLQSGLKTEFPNGQAVVLYPVGDRDLPPDAGAFYHAIRRWLKQNQRPDGEPILPPLGFHTSIRTERPFVIFTIVIGSALIGASIGLVVGLSPLIAAMTAGSICLAMNAQKTWPNIDAKGQRLQPTDVSPGQAINTSLDETSRPSIQIRK
ncbi:hypothetical protein EON82_19295 [bacterium]|nr:MAG: hypothetical protein EON82_19295 [bacterium]